MSEQEIKNVSGSAEEEKYLGILKKLTLEEKAALCSGLTFWTTTPLEKHGVPSVRMTDGPHGLRSEKESGGGTNIMKESHPATCFPPAVTSASTWDPELLEEVGNAIALEAKALGVSTVLGPGVNIKRSPLCGRNFEYFSEDPFLAGRMGAAWVHGVQKNDVGVSLKHFCANNQEHLRMSIDTIVDERALREIYLPAFEHIVKTEQPATVMCSYNRLNGTFLSDNKRMLTDILRDEWDFNGYSVTDFTGVAPKAAPKESILYNTTAFCGFGVSVDYWEDEYFAHDADMCAAIKANLKYILYPLVNSAAMNGQNITSHRVELDTPWRALYRNMQIGFGVATGVLIAGWIALEIVGAVQKKKEVR